VRHIRRGVNRRLKPGGRFKAAKQAQQNRQRLQRGALGNVVILVEFGFLQPAPSPVVVVGRVPLARARWFDVQYIITLSSSRSRESATRTEWLVFDGFVPEATSRWTILTLWSAG
jgi:hypothetical protein